MQVGRRRLIAGSLALAATTLTSDRLLRAQGSERVIAVVARKFVFLPSEIRLKLHEPAVLELTAPEVVMGFSVPELKMRTDIIPGQVARLRLRPEKVGTFDYLCDIFCGDGHEGMAGKLIVIA